MARQRTQRMVLWNSLLGADIAEHVQLLLVFSAHAFFLSGCVVETRIILGAGQVSTIKSYLQVMDTTVKTVVTFKSSAFNMSEPKEYFINPCCFGDDVARWLAEQLRGKGYQAAEVPGQEDFGWYFRFTESGIEHCFVIGHRPGDNNEEGLWIGWLERNRGFLASLVGARKRGVQPAAARAIHEILSGSPQIRNVRWHFERDFDSGREQAATPEPSSAQ